MPPDPIPPALPVVCSSRRADPAAATAARTVALVVAGCNDLLGLVVPVACAGCGRLDVPWCAGCAATLSGSVVRRDHDAGRLDLLDGRTLLPVWAPATYDGPLRHAVPAWKDGGRSDLDRPFAAAARRAGASTAVLLAAAPGRGRRPGVVAAPGTVPADDGRAGPLLVVPVPSAPRARRRRGRAPVDVLAAAVTEGLRDRGVPAVRAGVLARTGGPDLAGLSARSRGAALAGRVRVRRRGDLAGRRVLLVDDVLTTGATLAACHGALVGAGARVLGAVALAATPPPRPVRLPGFVRPAQRVVRTPAEEG